MTRHCLLGQLSRHNKQLQHLLKPVKRIQEEEAEGISSMLSLNNKQLSQMLKSSPPVQEEEEDPLAYYENHTSQIEVGPKGNRSIGREPRAQPLVTSAQV